MTLDFERLADEAAIKAVHIRYCRGIDRMDWELVRSCYHPDATDDHGGYRGGVEGFIAWAAEALKHLESTTHFTGNQFVELDGDTAWAEHYVRVYHRQPAGRIARRVIVVDSDRLDAVGATWASAELKRGKRNATDPSYDR